MSDDKNLNRRVLVIDDQASILADFEKILASVNVSDEVEDVRDAFFGATQETSAGVEFDVRTASQGEQAVELVKDAFDHEEPFAMAFVDVRMPPGMDGVQTVRELWKVDPSLQVVICTAYSDYSLDEITAELGHSDRLLILKKPFDPMEVRQLAGALTEKWNVIDRLNQQMLELREANERAEAASRAKSEFLANMSHEVRTPMNALLGYVDLMSDPEATQEERIQYARTIRKSGEHLLTILNDVLDISRIEASRLVVNQTDFNPFEVAREVARFMRVAAHEKDLELTLDVRGAIPQVIESDLVRVRQILFNLIGNALKFTEEGSVSLSLTLDENTSSDHRYLCFEVADTGIGFDPDEVEAIFDVFRVGDGSLTREYGGTGLGLTIAKRLAVLLGGDVDAKNRPGGGSVFTLRLYAGELRRALLLEYSPADCSLDEPGDEDVPSAITDRKVEGRVLVVEDVKFNQLLLAALLRCAGAEVEVASDGREGVEAVLAAERDGEPFDLVLMDMQMPVMDGYEATRELRRQGYSRPIVALTAHAMVGDREKCIEAGCDDYATKPIDKTALLALCHRLIALERPGAPLPSPTPQDETVDRPD